MNRPKSTIEWAVREHDDDVLEVVRQYQLLAEKCPLVLHDLSRACFAEDTTHVPGDPETTFVKEGRRSVFLHIKKMIAIDTDEIVQHQQKDKPDE